MLYDINRTGIQPPLERLNVSGPRTLVLGAAGLAAETHSDDLFGVLHLADYDLVIVEPLGSLRSNDFDYRAKIAPTNELRLSGEDADVYLRRLKTVTEKMNDFVSGGGFLVVFLRDLPTLNYFDSHRDFRQVSLNAAFPYGSLNPVSGTGENIETLNSQPYGEFWNVTTGALRYTCFVRTESRKDAIANVKGQPKQVVAIDFVPKDGGRIVLLPGPKAVPSVSLTAEFVGRVVNGIRSLYSELTSVVSRPTLPDWVGNYLLPGELEATRAISETNATIKGLYLQQKRQQKELSELQHFKTLIGGTGGSLELAVDRSLAELGMKIEAGKPKRVDRIGQWKNHFFAIEVQGVKNAAPEDHVRSLMMWCQEVALEKQQEPKGLLVVNGFRDTDVESRKKEIWPEKVAEICQRYRFCALSGIQLLGLLIEARSNPDRKDELIAKILATDGPFAGYDDWQNVLKKRNGSSSQT